MYNAVVRLKRANKTFVCAKTKTTFYVQLNSFLFPTCALFILLKAIYVCLTRFVKLVDCRLFRRETVFCFLLSLQFYSLIYTVTRACLSWYLDVMWLSNMKTICKKKIIILTSYKRQRKKRLLQYYSYLRIITLNKLTNYVKT